MAARTTTDEGIVNDESHLLTNDFQTTTNTTSNKHLSNPSSVSSLQSPTGLTSLIVFIVLTCTCISGFMSRLFSVIRFESIIHEFDPWFNYRSTVYMTDNGFYNFLNWFDDFAWYPLGRIVGGTVYPGREYSFVFEMKPSIFFV